MLPVSSSEWNLYVWDRMRRLYIFKDQPMGYVQAEAERQVLELAKSYPADKYHIKLVRTETIIIS